MQGATSLLSPIAATLAPSPARTHLRYHRDVLNKAAITLVPRYAVVSIYVDVARKFLTSLQLPSCFSLAAYNLGLTCTFQTTAATPYTGTDSSTFGFSAISCSSVLHCYSTYWHLNLLRASLPLQKLNSDAKYAIKDKVTTPATKFTLRPHRQSHIPNSSFSLHVLDHEGNIQKQQQQGRQAKTHHQTLENTNYFPTVSW